MFQKIADYLRMIKFSHTLFALPFAGIALVETIPNSQYWNYGPLPSLWLLVGKILICMATLRSAAMGFNRIVDEPIDKRNPRTANREIPSGKISKKSAWSFVILSSLLFVISAATINPLCAILSPVALLIVFLYSYTKRFTAFCHFFLGFAIGIAPMATSVAVLGTIILPCILWSAGLMLYITGFDILYATQDADFDRKNGLSSIPAAIGEKKSRFLAGILHFAAFILFCTVGAIDRLGIFYYIILSIVGGLFVWEHMLARNPTKIPFAFFNVNASISSMLLLAIVSDILLSRMIS